MVWQSIDGSNAVIIKEHKQSFWDKIVNVSDDIESKSLLKQQSCSIYIESYWWDLFVHVVNRKQANSPWIFSLEMSIMILIFAEKNFLFCEGAFSCKRSREVADISRAH